MSEAPSAAGTPRQQHQSYPSPSHDARLPFYQHVGDDQRHDQESNGDAQQNGGAAREDDGQSSTRAAGPDFVPDDPQMRANLERMMTSQFGSFGSLGALLPSSSQADQDAHFNGTSSHGPAPQVPFTHGSGSVDLGLPNQAREKAPRSKVSRACDECRRKKIRCDAADETGAASCSHCSRSGLNCAFSRQPLKRGPSKGYIKELAERLHSLEQQVHEPGVGGPHHQAEIQQVQRAIAENMQQGGYGQMMALQRSQGGYQADTGSVQPSQNGVIVMEPRAGDKRTHSVAEGRYGSMSGGWNSNTRPTPLPSQQAPPMPPQSHHPGYQPSYSQSQPTTQPPTPSHHNAQPFWRMGTMEPRQDFTSLPYEPGDLRCHGRPPLRFDLEPELY